MLELYTDDQNPSWYHGVSPSGNWGDRYSWHKQEIWKSNSWPRTTEDPQGDGFLHSDIKNVAYFFTHAVFSKIVEVGGLK